jgi:hypothetical protein
MRTAATAVPSPSRSLCLGVLLVDQATKAALASGDFVVNTGNVAALPAGLSDTLWDSPTVGAACDTVDTVLLMVALNLTRKLGNAWNRLASVAVIAGLLSNLADRLGASSLFHADLPRGAIDWIPVPLWPSARTNLADVAIALGVVVLGYQALRTAAVAVRGLTRRSRVARVAAATAAVLALAGWTTFWQANRNAVALDSPRPETSMSSPTTYIGPCCSALWANPSDVVSGPVRR